jgi:phosphohistidine swiveling domain-containing protein
MTLPIISPEIDPRYALDDPADQGRCFMRDPMHFPVPLSPLFQSVHPQVFSPGYRTAAREIGVPIADFQHRCRNNYLYECVIPVIPASDEEARELNERAEAGMRLAMEQMGRRWQDEHLPRLRELLASLADARELDPAAPLDPARVDALLAICVEGWTIHFRIAFPMLVSIQIFEEFLADVAGPEVDAHVMLTGLQTASVANGIAITDLAAEVRELGLAPLVLETPASELASALQAAPKGQELLDRIDVYLAEYGLTQSLFDFMVPTWLEDPTPLYGALRSYLETGGDNRAARAEQARRAEEAIAAMRARLASYPEPMRQQFEALLMVARDGSFLQEEHNFYIDQQLLSSVRLAFLALGRQIEHHGMLDRADHIFFLYVDEIRALLAGEQVDARALVAERQASYEAALMDVPPPFIGAPPAGPPPNNPVTRAMSRFFGWAPPAADDSGPLRGYPGSRGQIEAPAFVARSLDEASAIPVGHVLVTVTTTPSWTPLFGIASAVVTETGGPLSHCAIVAREYGLPAVVGVRGATTRIVTGQLIQVDGTVGEVALLA